MLKFACYAGKSLLGEKRCVSASRYLPSINMMKISFINVNFLYQRWKYILHFRQVRREVKNFSCIC